MIGEVKSFSEFKGYGFIKGNNNYDYFVHISQINRIGYKTLEVGEKVDFEPKKTYKGWQAFEVRVISTEKESFKEIANHFIFKKNPFTPQDPIIDTNKFAGRKEAIYNSIDNLYNGKNILITGPRGIGKSSLAYQLLYTTRGEKELLSKIDIKEDLGFNNITGDYRCVPGNTLFDIANGLISTLMANLGKRHMEDGRKNSTSINLKFFKYITEESEKIISTSDLSIMFVNEVEHIFQEYGFDSNGITFLIDEVDVIDSSIDLASFLKASVEKFRLNYQKSISLIIAGVTGTITNLLAQHQSSNRLFENIVLDKMSDDELKEIIQLHLQNTGVNITDQAISSIIKLSNNFPQPIHLLGYHAFKFDDDNNIDIGDIEKARDHIVQNLKKQEYDLKFDKLSSGKRIEVVRRFAQANYSTVNFTFLKQGLPHISERELFGIIGELEDKGIFERQYKGTYRFTEPLFKIYLRWIFRIEE